MSPLFAIELATLQPYMPYAVGCGVAAGFTSLVWYATRRPRRLELPPTCKNPDSWEQPEEDTYANRRSSSRREGTPIKVTFISPAFRGQMESGWVLDRSTGGLRIAVSQPLAVGSIVQVRAENAPDTIPWVTLIIRSCRDEGKHYEAGCAFEETPPWNVLLLFG